MKTKLVFEDHFEVDGRPNPEYWKHDIGGHGFGNNELQFYTDSLENSYVKDGLLHIVAKKEKYENNEYTSAKLTTRGLNSIEGGRVEIRAKLPKGLGSWPAFWMMPDSFHEGNSWPKCGEIDIMEHLGRLENQIHVSAHTGAYNHNLKTQFTSVNDLEGVTEEFKTYIFEWDDEEMSFYMDDILLGNLKKRDRQDISEMGWPFHQPFYLILNLAVGGFWGGEVDDTSLPWEILVDFVKVYKKL